MKAKKSAIKAKHLEYGRLYLELLSARDTIGRGEMVICDLTKCVYTGYKSLMRAQASIYCNCINELLKDAQSQDDDLGGFLVLVEANSPYVFLENKHGDEEHEICDPPHKGGHCGDVIEVISSWLSPCSWGLVTVLLIFQ